ncbi:AI-2E family transporter [uncultured Kiloniella sp.]|uniref:AI-2E family transporter n=1 Tax=uncultured Kiloniella sp. TaxID=1133091 RepID=UPI0026331549|nr:AI-2E family transporter [uncultured Kiloniella sp.]
MTDRTLQYRYLGFISLVLGFAVVHWLKPVLLPVTIALFMTAVAWPINTWLNKIFPKRISHILSYVALICILSMFAGICYMAIAEFTASFPKYEIQFITLLQDFRSVLRDFGFPPPGEVKPEQIQDLITPLITTFYTTLGHTVLVVALVMLGLPELIYWEDKLENCLGKTNGNRWGKAATDAAKSFHKYMTVMTGIGAISTVLTTGFAWITGLDFALLWGLLAFIFNFIPVLGAMLILIPTTFMAIMQFGDTSQVWVILVGMGTIQFFIGNVVDPKFQGKFLSMSPIVILISIAFWSFLWGVPGAFLAVPLTHIFMVTCYQFPNTKKIACLLSEGKGTCDA